jgi:uncharacterized protein YhfF
MRLFMSLTELAQKYFDTYVEGLSTPILSSNVSANMAGNKEIADHLLSLYLRGKKTAGSGLVRDYKKAGDPLPQIGDLWVVLDSNGVPNCILKTIRVEINKFKDVPEEVAFAEGEGDSSLRDWRELHKRFFMPFLLNCGIENIDEEEVVTEFFRMEYRHDKIR